MVHKITKLSATCLLAYGLVFFIGIIFTSSVLASKLDNMNQSMLMPASLTQSNKTNIQTPLFAGNGEIYQKTRLTSEFSNLGSWTSVGMGITYVEGGDRYAKSIAFSNKVLAIGAPGERAVYLYKKTKKPDNEWMQYAIIRKSLDSPTAQDFGKMLALSGDKLVVSGENRVYVYKLKNDLWLEQYVIQPDDIGIGDDFGISLDINNDTLVIGAIGDDSTNTTYSADNLIWDSGAVYVYNLTEKSAEMVAYLKAPNPQVRDLFGYSVSISDSKYGELIVVGALGSSYAAVYRNNKNKWSYIQALPHDNCLSFGSSVAVEYETIAVGCPRGGITEDDETIYGGVVYVYELLPSSGNDFLIREQAKLFASNREAGDWFGYAVDIKADVIVASAIYEDSLSGGINGDENDNSGYATGAVYVFKKEDDEWNQQYYIKSSSPTPGQHFWGNNDVTNDNFGSTVALSENEIVVGAFFENFASGAAYIFATDSVDITANHTGLWYDREQPAHSLSYYLLEENYVVALWATFDNDGRQMSLIGVGKHDGYSATLEVHTRSGGNFPPNPRASTVTKWGQFKINFTDCSTAFFSWMPFVNNGFGSGSTKLSRLTNTNGLDCNNVETDLTKTKTFSMKDSNSALWSNSGGEFLTNTYMLANDRIVHIWYTFDNDGNPIWLQSVGTHDGVTATMDAYIFAGGNFPPNYNHEDVSINKWGVFELEFADCNNGLFKWTPEEGSDYSSGEVALHRLTITKDLQCQN